MSARRRILVIDDDVETRTATSELLDDVGFSVSTARHGLEALQMLRSGLRPSAMLVDLRMPVMDGEAFCRACDADLAIRKIPRVIISSLSPGPGRVRGCKARAFVAKPIDPAQLFDLLRRIARA